MKKSSKKLISLSLAIVLALTPLSAYADDMPETETETVFAETEAHQEETTQPETVLETLKETETVSETVAETEAVKETEAPAETEEPVEMMTSTITSDGITLTESDPDNGVYTFKVKNIVAPKSAALTKVMLYMWTETNGKDDRRGYVATKIKGTKDWTVTVDIGRHGYAADTYNLQVYADDANGLHNSVAKDTFVPAAAKINTFKADFEKNSSKATITLSNALLPADTSTVKFSIYGKKDGTADKKIYVAKKLDFKTYQVELDLMDHNEVGDYYVSASGKTPSTTIKFASGSFTVETVTGKVRILEKDRVNGYYTLALDNIVAPADITRVDLKVWSEKDGKNVLKSYKATKTDGKWTAKIDIAYHNAVAGTYNAYAYVSDARGFRICAAKLAFTVAEPTVVPTIEPLISDKNGTVTLKIKNLLGDTGEKTVRVKVWGEKDGTKDYHYYYPTYTTKPRNWSTVVPLTRHMETGDYHAVLYRKNGTSWKKITETTFKISKLPNQLRFEDKDDNMGTVTLKLYRPVATKPFTQIKFIAWSEANGQDDVQTYVGTQSGYNYLATLDAMKHNAAKGTYIVHAYAVFADGTEQLLDAGTVNITHNQRVYQNPSGYYQIRDSIAIGGGGYNLTYDYEGMKVAKIIDYFGINGGNYVGLYACIYGSQCANAVTNFQRSHGLPATGVVDLATWRTMGLSDADWYTNLSAYVSPLYVNPSSTRSDHIEAMIKRAYEYLGTPYVIGASSYPGTGVDCSGLVMQALFSAGIDMSPINPIRHAHLNYEYESANIWASPYMLHVPYAQRQRGDLVIYQNSSGSVIHVAIYLGDDTVIEATCEPFNRVVVQPLHNAYRSNVKGILRPFQ